jgi:hypothetical protein
MRGDVVPSQPAIADIIDYRNDARIVMRRSKFDFMRSFEPTALHHGRRCRRKSAQTILDYSCS